MKWFLKFKCLFSWVVTGVAVIASPLGLQAQDLIGGSQGGVQTGSTTGSTTPAANTGAAPVNTGFGDGASTGPGSAPPATGVPTTTTGQPPPNTTAPGTTAPGSANPPTAPGAPPSGTQPAPGQTTSPPPSMAAPAAPMTWSTRTIHEELLASVAAADEKILKQKTAKSARLSDTKVAQLKVKLSRNRKDIKSRLRLAEHYQTIPKYNQITVLLNTALAQLPQRGLMMLAHAYREIKDHENEKRILEIALAKKENDHVTQYALGEALISLSKKSEAITRFDQARKINKKYLPAYLAILRENKRGGYFHDSLQLLQDMVEIFGDKGTFLNDICLLNAHEAFFEKGVEACQNAISNDPDDPTNHVFLGLLIRERDGNDVAEKIIKKTAQQFINSELAQYVMGELSWERKNFPVAYKFFRGAAQNKPSSARSQLGLGKAAFDLQKYDEALNAFVRACTLNRNMVADFRRSSATLRQKGESALSAKYDAGLLKCGLN